MKFVLANRYVTRSGQDVECISIAADYGHAAFRNNSKQVFSVGQDGRVSPVRENDNDVIKEGPKVFGGWYAIYPSKMVAGPFESAGAALAAVPGNTKPAAIKYFQFEEGEGLHQL